MAATSVDPPEPPSLLEADRSGSGTPVGEVVGAPLVGDVEGEVVGTPLVGEIEGVVVGAPLVGEIEGEVVGEPMGAAVGTTVGPNKVGPDVVGPDVIGDPIVSAPCWQAGPKYPSAQLQLWTEYLRQEPPK